MTDPRTRGAAPPYVLLRPWPMVHSGMPCSLAMRTIAWTCSVVVGETAAEASHSSDCL